jgi:putative ATPase
MIDKDEDGHYNAVSALQKSIRGSDVNAALYYLARLIAANDLDSIERRLSVTAYEDVGLGNPSAVDRTFNAIETAKKVGFPEAIIPLSFAVIDLALSPKSKSAYLSIKKAVELYRNKPIDMPDYLHLTPANLNDNQKYPYEKSDAWVKIAYLPYQLRKEKLYEYAQSGNYERALVENYLKLSKIERTYNLEEINKN